MSSNISVEDNKIMVLADFDDTLINCDSMVTILKKEKWYLNFSFICAGLGIIVAKLTKGDVLKKRSKLKYLMLEKFDDLSEDKINEYVKYFTSCINKDVIDKINSMSPDKIVIASASSKELIVKVLEGVLHVDAVIANSIRDDGNRGTIVPINAFKTCYGEEKARRFCAEVGDYNQYDIYVFSDSLSDMPIFELGKEKYLVKDGELSSLSI